MVHALILSLEFINVLSVLELDYSRWSLNPFLCRLTIAALGEKLNDYWNEMKTKKNEEYPMALPVEEIQWVLLWQHSTEHSVTGFSDMRALFDVFYFGFSPGNSLTRRGCSVTRASSGASSRMESSTCRRSGTAPSTLTPSSGKDTAQGPLPALLCLLGAAGVCSSFSCGFSPVPFFPSGIVTCQKNPRMTIWYIRRTRKPTRKSEFWGVLQGAQH